MLHEDVQDVLDLEQRVVGGVCEHFDHVAQLGVEVVDSTKLLVCNGDLELDSLCLPGLLSASIELQGNKPFFFRKEWLALTLAATEALNDSLQLDLVVFDGLLALGVVNVNVDLDFISRCVPFRVQ
jgi:hypothetical protein